MTIEDLEEYTGFKLDQEVYHRANGDMGVVLGFVTYSRKEGMFVKLQVSYGIAWVEESYPTELSDEKPVKLL